MMVSFVLSFFPRDVLDEILNLIESVSEDFPSYSSKGNTFSSFLIVNIYLYFTKEKFETLNMRSFEFKALVILLYIHLTGSTYRILPTL